MTSAESAVPMAPRIVVSTRLKLMALVVSAGAERTMNPGVTA
jgi:hypothetical protein